VASRLRRSSRFYRFLWEIRDQLFTGTFEDKLIASYAPRGQEPCPAAMMAMVMLLQRYDGLSDADAVDAAENDRRWQLVLGILGTEQAPFGQGSLVRFRARMIANDLDKELLNRTVELAKQTGGFGWKKLRVALDSSPLHGAGRVEDSWNLIGRAMAKVVRTVSLATGQDEAAIVSAAGLNVLQAPSIKAALDTDWDDPEARAAALEYLLGQVAALESWVERHAQEHRGEPPLKDDLELLRAIVEQDTEPDPSGGGERRLKQEVAKDRIISVHDPEMRHGRKSRTKRFNGYKRHIAVVDQIVVGTSVLPANIREHEPTEDLLSAAKRYGSIEVLDIDRGYLPSPVVGELHADGVTIHSRPHVYNPKCLFTKEDFTIDLENRTVVCPAGKTATLAPRGQAYYDATDCAPCRLKEKCTKSNQRSITLHRDEELFIRLRAAKKTPVGRAELRKRSVVEHRLARVGAIQGHKSRYRGTRKNLLDLNRASAVANLMELQRRKAA